MEQSIAAMRGHVIICGWGRVGRSIAAEVAAAGRPYVIVELDEDRVADTTAPVVIGDATVDQVLEEAGIARAAALVAAVESDAGNSFITLGARSLNQSLFIVARARQHDSEAKLARAGAEEREAIQDWLAHRCDDGPPCERCTWCSVRRWVGRRAEDALRAHDGGVTL